MQSILKTLLAILAALIFSIAFERIAPAQSPGDGPNVSPPDFFIEAEIDNDNPYLGEQITYTLRRYQTVEFPNQPHYREHPFTGFWNTPLIQRPSYTTTINGREYTVHPTHMALFANLAGPVTIEPSKLVIPGQGLETDTILESNPVNVRVRPLPEGAPSHFRGTVGQFEINAKFTEDEVPINQPTTLIIEIKGNGNIEALLEPDMPMLEHWAVDPFFGFGGYITTNMPLSKEVIKGSRKFEWSLYPLTSGQQFFPAIRFSYFDPQTATYHSIRTNPTPITVLADANSSTFSSPVPEVRERVRRLAGDIRHIKPVPHSLANSTATAKFAQQTFFLSCATIPLLAVGGVWLWHRRREQALANTPAARQQQARRRAIKMLNSAYQSVQPYASVRQAITTYLSDKLDQPISSLTSDQLLNLLNELQMDPQLTDQIQNLLAQADTGHFAPISSQQAIHALITDTRILIDNLEKFFTARGV